VIVFSRLKFEILFIFLAVDETLCFCWDKKTWMVFCREGLSFAGIE